jgi:aspartyl-tRNA(Asn)/glutamyl-tRNA(Gln) amidotransferase subunit C
MRRNSGRAKLILSPAGPEVVCYNQTNMAKLSRDDVLKLAKLARLSLSDDELQAFTGEFEEILNYVEQLQSVDTDGLEPTNQVSGNVNVMRDDELIDYGYEPRGLLQNAPQTEDDQIKVRRMVG